MLAASRISGMVMHYRTDNTHFHAHLIKPDHAGWVAVGFAEAPGVVIGARAIVGAPAASPQVRLYYLGGTSVSSVTPLAPSAQTLEAASLDTSGSGVAMTFRMLHGPIGSSRDVLSGTTHLIFAGGPMDDGGSWHPGNATWDGITASLVHLEQERFVTPPPPSLPPPTPPLRPPYAPASSSHGPAPALPDAPPSPSLLDAPPSPSLPSAPPNTDTNAPPIPPVVSNTGAAQTGGGDASVVAVIIAIVVLVLGASAGGGVYFYRKHLARPPTATAQTSKIKIEDLTASSHPDAPPMEELEQLEMEESKQTEREELEKEKI